MAEYTIDEGVDKGIQTQVHFEGGEIIHQKTFDAEPYLLHAANARQQTEGKRWGDGKFIGTIPPAFYAPICAIRDPQERQAAVLSFFRENPAFVMFDRFGK